MTLISQPALRRLQTLFAQFARRSFDVSNTREDRLRWASEMLGREVASFKYLDAAEGKRLIDQLQGLLGLAETAPPRRRPRSKTDTQKLGTEGRRDQLHDDITMVDGTEDVFRLIQQQMTRLGMDEARLQRFLLSRVSPLQGRTAIRILGDANKVYWALKGQADARQTRSAHPAAHPSRRQHA